MLCACVSLPMWFPPQEINGQTYIDSVFITDANIEEAMTRGADEVWVAWTVSRRSEWRDGFVSRYFRRRSCLASGMAKRRFVDGGSLRAFARRHVGGEKT
jgi:predicted acylesterase/phospholipase RssA